ncbi:MAG: tyrosine-protein phosphatase [Clostridium sp.]|uniref:tyrosine-protein phosphatase n=1 Tax=Clostridium sp. TaxID=1506 RepID=UPI0030247C44
MEKNMNGVGDVLRVINVPHITNFRDLGGCPCGEGKVVKPKQFYRCAGLSNLDESDFAILKEQNLKIIVDLRSKAEKEKEPDIVPPECEYYHYSGIVTMDDPNNLANQFGGNMDMKSAVIDMLQNKREVPNPMEYLKECYKTMAEHSNSFKALFDLIKMYPEKPIAFHCSAGKDRTGVAAALILLSLGASEETVMEDYLLSNVYRKAENDIMIEMLKKYTTEEVFLNLIRSMLEVNAELLNTYFDKVKELYGTWDNYFEKAIGVSAQERKELKERYLV